jgi:hypothetical protein
MDRIENDAPNNFRVVECVLFAVVTLFTDPLRSNDRAGTQTDTKTNGRDL